MKKNLFETKEEIESAVSNFTTLLQHPGWKLYVEVAEANIEMRIEDILNNPHKLTEVEMNILREGLKVMKDMISSPESLLNKLKQSEEDSETDTDPYDTLDTLTPRSADREIDKDSQTE